jgi:secreted protein with Ig-like and vWFA domain/anti-sigma factor RsiW
MNDTKLLPDDPKLTAYALGELEGDEHAAVEAALRHDPAARAAVEEIRATAAQLEGALAAEAAAEAKLPLVPQLERAAIIPGRDLRKLDGGPMGKLINFPQVYYVIGGLAAACVAVMMAFWPPPPHSAPAQKHYTEFDLAQLPTAMPVALPVAGSADVGGATVAVDAETALKSEAMTESANRVVVAFDAAKAQGDFAKKPVPQTAEITVPGAANPMMQQAVGGTTNMPRADLTLRKDGATGGQTQSFFTSPLPAAAPVLTLRENGSAAPAAAARAPRVAQAVVATAPAATDSVVQLSAFEVTDSKAAAYAASNTLAGTRLNSRVQDLAASTNVANGSLAAATAQQWSAAGSGTGKLGFAFGASAPAPSERARDYFPSPAPAGNTEAYAFQADNDFLGAAQNPLSTFAIDVDTASYSNVRRFLESGHLPPRDAVRVEELVNYFPYDYPAPAAPLVAAGEKRGQGTASPPESVAPFAASLEVADAPWAPTHRLVRIGLKGREVATDVRPAANLVFLLDVSGSMAAPNRLPLVKESMRLLVGKLRRDDRVAIVTYAGQSGLALPSTPAANSSAILAALDALNPGGSTNGAMGIQLAYDIAKANLVPGGINRVILCTDGDFNVGVTSEGDLVRLIEEKAKSGVALTALGFGMGNLKDSTLEKLADKGDGNYGYIDTRREAEKLLVEQVNGTLMTIAKDVKIQVEFNPAKVASYRLIGYEDRMLKKEDFNNDKVDAGEIGAGHTVTALYEIVPVGAENNPAVGVPAVDELKYAAKTVGAKSAVTNSAELLTVKLRYKQPAGDVSAKLEFPLTDAGGRFEQASADFKFAAAVAEFAMILRDSPHKGAATLGDVLAWAAAATAHSGADAGGHRGEFLDLVRKAQALVR